MLQQDRMFETEQNSCAWLYSARLGPQVAWFLIERLHDCLQLVMAAETLGVLRQVTPTSC